MAATEPHAGLRRVVVPACDAAAPGPAAQLSEYEVARAARVARNQATMAALGVTKAAAALSAPAVWRRTKPGAAAGGGERRAKRPAEAAPEPPARVSKRIRVRAGLAEPEPDGSASEQDAGLEAEEDRVRMLTVDEYLERKGLPKGPLMTGHFTGWVEEGVRQRLGLAASAAEAWESEGGGKFDRRVPKGESAKEFARSMLRKNPNAYFYRHNVPGEDMWQGEWSEEEVALFVKVAMQHGCGDKWGLFASYIPHRVGYQCSAAYRHIIIPRGLLRDNHFLMTSGGEAVWAGGRNRKSDDN